MAALNVRPAGGLKEQSQLARAAAWLGGACLAGTALGAAIALLVG